MSKIYETRQDLQRDTLNAEHHAVEADRNLKSTSAISSTAVALGLSQARQLEQLTEKQSFFSKAIAPIAAVSAALAGWDIIQFFRDRSKLRTIETQLAALGPEHIVLPADVQPGDAVNTGLHGAQVARINGERQEIEVHAGYSR